jgi:hypothetical protein
MYLISLSLLILLVSAFITQYLNRVTPVAVGLTFAIFACIIDRFN